MVFLILNKIRAYDEGYHAGFHTIGLVEEIHMDSANTGIMRGITDGFKVNTSSVATTLSRLFIPLR